MSYESVACWLKVCFTKDTMRWRRATESVSGFMLDDDRLNKSLSDTMLLSRYSRYGLRRNRHKYELRCSWLKLRSWELYRLALLITDRLHLPFQTSSCTITIQSQKDGPHHMRLMTKLAEELGRSLRSLRGLLTSFASHCAIGGVRQHCGWSALLQLML